LLIWGLFGLFKAHKGHLVLVVIYRVLKHLDLSNYNKIEPAVAHFEANFAAFWPFKDQMRGPLVPQTSIFNLYV
jgi:hypothetical protein